MREGAGQHLPHPHSFSRSVQKNEFGWETEYTSAGRGLNDRLI